MTSEKATPTTLIDIIETMTTNYSDRVALVAVDDAQTRRYTFGELSELTAKARCWLHAQGLGMHDRVFICSNNSAEMLVLMLACATRGAVAVPIDSKTSPETLERLIQAGEPAMVATSREDLRADLPVYSLDRLFDDIADFEPMAPSTEVSADSLLFLFYTSGTTGTPKAVQSTHGNLTSNVVNVSKLEDLDRGDRMLSMAPLCHVLGLSIGLFIPWYSGNTVILTTSLTPDVMMRVFQEERVTSIVTVPLFLDRVRAKIETKLREEGRLEGFVKMQNFAMKLPVFVRRIMFKAVLKKLAPWLRWVGVGGAPLSPETERFWEAIGVKIIKGYGLTESFIASCSAFDARHFGSVGQGVPGQEIRIDKSGEIWLRGPNVTPGYANAPEANDAAFEGAWFRTGDLGHFDDKGNLFITGRIKNVIIGPTGLNIYPEDIEQVLVSDHRIEEAVVIESPERPGRLWAVVVPASGCEHVHSDTLRDELNMRLSSHQRIQQLLARSSDDLPRTGTQKIKRNVLVEQVRESFAPRKAAA